MPHITYTLSSGRPLIDAYIGLSKSRLEAYQTAGKIPPSPMHARALIDTGATSSCIDTKIIRGLNLTPRGKAQCLTASSGTAPVITDQYDVSVIIPLPVPVTGKVRSFTDILVMEYDLSLAGIQAIIGCDILSEGILILNGEQFILSF